MSVSVWGNRGSSIRPRASRPDTSNFSGRRRGRIVADLKLQVPLPPQLAQRREPRRELLGQAIAQLGRDLHALGLAADRTGRASARSIQPSNSTRRKPSPANVPRSRLARVGTGCQLPRGDRLQPVLASGRQHKVDVSQHERAGGRLQGVENLDDAVLADHLGRVLAETGGGNSFAVLQPPPGSRVAREASAGGASRDAPADRPRCNCFQSVGHSNSTSSTCSNSAAAALRRPARRSKDRGPGCPSPPPIGRSGR